MILWQVRSCAPEKLSEGKFHQILHVPVKRSFSEFIFLSEVPFSKKQNDAPLCFLKLVQQLYRFWIYDALKI